VDDHLASFKPEVGQGVLIKAGTVHSLGDGVMVFEVQDNSDKVSASIAMLHDGAYGGRRSDSQANILGRVDRGGS
jgi:hypothetical protein